MKRDNYVNQPIRAILSTNPFIWNHMHCLKKNSVAYILSKMLVLSSTWVSGVLLHIDSKDMSSTKEHGL